MRKKILLITVILLAAVLLSGCVGSTAWPGLSAANEVAYLANTSAVHAIDLKSGNELWSFAGEKSGGLAIFGKSPKIFVSTPVVSEDGLVIILDSGNNQTMYAVDPNDIVDGAPKVAWKFNDVKSHWIAPPLIIGNRLFAPNSDGKIYVLDLQDGKSEKQAIKIIEPFKDIEGQPGRLWSQPVTDGKYIFVTSLDHSIFAIDLETYKIIWHADLNGAIPGSVVLGSDGMLYVGSLANQLEKFDPATGKHEPVLDTQGWIWGTPVVDGDNIYFSDVDGYFYSYNTEASKLNWEPIKPDSAITASPLIHDGGVLLVTESGNVYFVDAAGSMSLWHESTDGKAYTTPVSAGGYVLVSYIESDYYLIALDEEGDQQWTFPAGK
jgi:eukaryotic-like serine/threonine-protein kinase